MCCPSQPAPHGAVPEAGAAGSDPQGSGCAEGTSGAHPPSAQLGQVEEGNEEDYGAEQAKVCRVAVTYMH